MFRQIATMARRIACLFLLSLPLFTVPAQATDSMMNRGEYLARIMDCGGCHTPGALMGAPEMERQLTGGNVGFAIPGLGIFYPPNLTSDEETGLGLWTVDEIVAAIRTGERPDGRVLAPAMPYHAYSAMTDNDARALATYLAGLPAVANSVPAPVGPDEAAPLPYLTMAMPVSN
ncbi:MAG: cytochrome c [Alphaproteobacteria bacterium]